MLSKVSAPVLHCLGKPVQRRRIATTYLRQPRKQARPASGSRFQVLIWAEGGGNATGECLVGSQSSVPVEIVARIIGGCDEGNVEGVHESAGQEIRLGDSFSDGVVDAISVLRAGSFGNAKNADKLVNEPITHRCSSKITPVLA